MHYSVHYSIKITTVKLNTTYRYSKKIYYSDLPTVKKVSERVSNHRAKVKKKHYSVNELYSDNYSLGFITIVRKAWIRR